ncbi:MAG: LON peptidase substrate-binding domain-containing protein, partial [Bosea sp. (in: a-proteobacteria)]
MGMNATYKGPLDCPVTVPLFPLNGALLLPRGQMPLNIFEPRYMAMIDDALMGHRCIGIIQPDGDDEGKTVPALQKVGCLGRITQLAETGDNRYMLTLTGVSRFRLVEELSVTTPYRQARAAYEPFISDFVARAGEEDVDRRALLAALKSFAEANELKIDWKGVNDAPNEALVNALSMMCPFGPREKQALLEAP